MERSSFLDTQTENFLFSTKSENNLVRYSDPHAGRGSRGRHGDAATLHKEIGILSLARASRRPGVGRLVCLLAVHAQRLAFDSPACRDSPIHRGQRFKSRK